MTRPNARALLLIACAGAIGRPLVGCGDSDQPVCNNECAGSTADAEAGERGRASGGSGDPGSGAAAGTLSGGTSQGGAADGGAAPEGGWGGSLPVAGSTATSYAGEATEAGAGGKDVSQGALSIAPVALPPAELKRAYTAQLVANGGSGGYVFTVVNGVLPAPFVLSATGLLSGVPAQEGVLSFTVRVTDSGGNFGLRSLKLRVWKQRWLAYQLTPLLPPPPLNLLDMNSAGFPVTVLPNAKTFSFSPDGRWLLYSTSTELDVVDVSSGTIGAPVTLVTASIDKFTWAPDSDWISFHTTSADVFYAVRASNGAKLTLGNMAPQLVASRWGTRAVFEQCQNIGPIFGSVIWSCTVSYAALDGATPSALPTFQTLVTGASERGGWVGDAYYIIDGYPANGHSYAKFGPAGFESVNTIATTISTGLTLTARQADPPIAFFSSPMAAGSINSAYYPNLWFELDTAQAVERPRLGGDPALAYSPSLTHFALATENTHAQVFRASQPQGPALGSVPIRSGLTTDDSVLSWSPAEDLAGSVPGYTQVYVTWLDSSGASLPVPGNFDDVQGVGGVQFGMHSDWVCFNGYRSDNVWHRWFSAIQGKTFGAAQEFGDTDYGGPVESPDGTLIALHDGNGFSVARVTAGVLGTPQQLIALPNHGYVGGQQWSTDAVHFIASVDASNNGDDQLFIVDVTNPTSTAQVLGHSLPGPGGSFAMQP
ncbi:MAG: Ig domain-containing protein [Polyangiaceae bacterium]